MRSKEPGRRVVLSWASLLPPWMEMRQETLRRGGEHLVDEALPRRFHAVGEHHDLAKAQPLGVAQDLEEARLQRGLATE